MNLKRLSELLSLFSPWKLGFKAIEVSEAFESPAQNPTAHRHGVIAFLTLLLGAALLLSAAAMNGIPNRRIMSERLGESGLVFLIICIYQGLRYKEANAPSQNTNLDTDE